jgi:protease-4
VAAAVGVKRDDLSLLFLSRYAKKNKPSFSSCGSAKVAYLNLSGAIHEGESESDLAGNVTSIGSDTVCRCLRGIAQEPSFKAVLIHISSGGGAYTASDQIAHAVRLVKAAGKKVVVAMHGVAASGGYFVVRCARPGVARSTRATLTPRALAGPVR